MSVYTIKDLEKLSTQKAHTIRIWEQRYALLTPERTDTNIRYYDDDQLKKLLNVCTLIDRGMKISHISKLSKSEMADEIAKVIVGTYQEDIQLEGISSQSLIAISSYNESMFNEMYATAVGTLGLQETYVRVIYPLLLRTGLLWTNDVLLPAQEHFLSNLIRQKFFAAIESLPLPATSDQSWILFLNEEEDHEIGLLFANYLLRQHGKKVIYLGARVPYENLSGVIRNSKTTHLYTFFVKNQLENKLEKLVANLTSDFADTTLCISGGGDKLKDLPKLNNIHHISTIESLLEIIKS